MGRLFKDFLKLHLSQKFARKLAETVQKNCVIWAWNYESKFGQKSGQLIVLDMNGSLFLEPWYEFTFKFPAARPYKPNLRTSRCSFNLWGTLEYLCCTHAWPEVFKTYLNCDNPSPGKTPSDLNKNFAQFSPQIYPLTGFFGGHVWCSLKNYP